MANTNSPYYPYYRVQENYCDLRDTVSLARKICDYLLDAPKGNYTPKDDNSYPRCRLWKYLFYDGAEPLKQTLPTIEQKMAVLFNPKMPDSPPTDKGYRLIPQMFIPEAQTEAQTRIYVRMGRTLPSNDNERVVLSVVFTIWTNYAQELNTQDECYSRCFAIEQALIEALHGVNMVGSGTFFFSRTKHADCGSKPIYDGKTNVGRELTLGLELISITDNGISSEDMPYISGNIRMA